MGAVGTAWRGNELTLHAFAVMAFALAGILGAVRCNSQRCGRMATRQATITPTHSPSDTVGEHMPLWTGFLVNGA